MESYNKEKVGGFFIVAVIIIVFIALISLASNDTSRRSEYWHTMSKLEKANVCLKDSEYHRLFPQLVDNYANAGRLAAIEEWKSICEIKIAGGKE